MTRARRECRKVIECHFAALYNGPAPFGKPKGLSSSQRAGLRYEKAVVEALRERYDSCMWGQWFRFKDINGPGLCQPDIILRLPEGVFVLEVKLTECLAGRTQIADLYLPVLRRVYGPCVWGVEIAKNLAPATPKDQIVETLDRALLVAPFGLPIVHWPQWGVL